MIIKRILQSAILITTLNNTVYASAAPGTLATPTLKLTDPIDPLDTIVYDPIAKRRVPFSDLVGKVAIAAREKNLHDDKTARELCTFNSKAKLDPHTLVLVRTPDKTFTYGLIDKQDGSTTASRLYYSVYVGHHVKNKGHIKKTFQALDLGKIKS